MEQGRVRLLLFDMLATAIVQWVGLERNQITCEKRNPRARVSGTIIVYMKNSHGGYYDVLDYTPQIIAA